jgi:serine/threonine protein kinase
MDFGLSKKWYNKGNHIEYKDGRSMIGTTRYASTNIHMGIEPSRRDDIESIGYMLVYLIKGRLPWQGLMKKTKDNPIDKIGDKKININLKKLCDGIPKCFYEFIRYAKKLEFDEKPDYEYLINIIKKSAEEENIQIKYFFE